MLRMEHLTKCFGEKKAVDDLSLHILPGEIYGFIGHNGAGKTTTIKACCGIQRQDSGEIFIDGISMRDDPIACKARLAYIPDNPDLYEFMTGTQYLNFIADVFGVPEKERTAAFKKYGDLFELTENLGDLISSYSHGMKQKLTLIAALCHNPRLLVLDEPFVGLDPLASRMLKDVMHELCASGGAIFFSTHVLDVAEKLCNKVAIIREGQLVASGETKALTGGRSLEELFLEVVEHAPAD